MNQDLGNDLVNLAPSGDLMHMVKIAVEGVVVRDVGHISHEDGVADDMVTNMVKDNNMVNDIDLTHMVKIAAEEVVVRDVEHIPHEDDVHEDDVVDHNMVTHIVKMVDNRVVNVPHKDIVDNLVKD